jgi:hypothetical protein
MNNKVEHNLNNWKEQDKFWQSVTKCDKIF